MLLWWPLWALPGTLILFLTAGRQMCAAGDRTAVGLGIARLQRKLTLLRFLRQCCSPPASVSCVGSLGFVGLMAPHSTLSAAAVVRVSLLC